MSIDKFETFFEPTRIWLFGKRFDSLRYYPDSMEFIEYGTPDPNGDDALPSPPKRIERTLRRGLRLKKDGTVGKFDPDDPKEKGAPFFARIYSFSYEAHYYRLPRPLLFLVSDEGTEVGGFRGGEGRSSGDGNSNNAGNPPRAERHSRGNVNKFTAALTGVEARDWDFSNDIRVWKVDRKDLSVCLDVEVGNYQEILLDSMIASDRRDDDRATRSRGDIIGRGAGSFRGDMIGPHQNK